MVVQANLRKGMIFQSKATMRSSTQATMNVASPLCLGLQDLKASSWAFPRVVLFTACREVSRESEPSWAALRKATALGTTSHTMSCGHHQWPH
ncbi:hypothetical protein H5410_045696 [Solanum commersonii]|uniref:Uncharacterized protein n=1 Tax=Solanum commersonii TaxID=4109 RepID=A0A9J5XDG8_SOLCO|nr:hypothetical protein H5410_045696 [Solanum commersonii]